MTVPVDTLVRGRVGFTDRVREMRVFRVSPFGWVSGINTESGRQSIMYDFETLDGPRPEKQRTDIPAHLRDERRAKAVPA